MNIDTIKTQLSRLNEFNYTFGDPRPTLFQYIMHTFKRRVQSYVDPDVALLRKDLYINTCGTDDAGNYDRVLKHPSTNKVMKEFVDVVENGRKPFVVIPTLIVNKHKCVLRNRSTHMNLIILNRKTKEIERIDIKKYHLKDFVVKVIYKKYKKEFEHIFKNLGLKAKLAPDHEIPHKYVRKHKGIDIKSLYPIYMLAYLHVRMNKPKLTIAQSHAKVASMPLNKLYMYWNKYVKFCQQVRGVPSKACKEDEVLNLESNKCMARTSKRYDSYVAAKPPKACADGKTFDIFTNRCVPPEKLKDINIMLDDVAGIANKINRRSKFVHLGGKQSSLAGLAFVLSKYTNGYLVMPPAAELLKKNDLTKREYMMTWRFLPQKDRFKLTVIDRFWDYWDKGMKSDARFLIVPITLRSSAGGYHANVLIYDKHTNEMERFDALGAWIHESYNSDGMDEAILAIFRPAMGVHLPEGFEYFTPMDYCPRLLFQMKEMTEATFEDIGGNCAVWRLWYVDARLANPNLTRKQVVTWANKKIEQFGSFQRFIKAYQTYVARFIKVDPNDTE